MAIENALVADDEHILKRWRNTRAVLWLLIVINTVVLISISGWLYFDRNAPDRSSPLLNNVCWWSQPWGVYVPIVTSKISSDASRGAELLGFLLAMPAMLIAAAGAYFGHRHERVILLFSGLSLTACWMLIGINWDVIRLRGQSAALVASIAAVREFSQELDASWPEQGGEIDDFGAFLAYPYGTPCTLLMLGDARIPTTPLRVAAVERTPGVAIRYQLTADAPDVWMEWRLDRSPPSSFQSGLNQFYNPVVHYKITENMYVVKYLENKSGIPES